MENPLRQDLWRAGHAHADVWLILALVALRYVDEANSSNVMKWLVRGSIPIAAILVVPPSLYMAGSLRRAAMAVISVRAENKKGPPQEQPLYTSAYDLGSYSVEVTKVADLDALYGHTNGTRRGRQSRNLDAVRRIVGIEQGTDAREARHRKLEKIEPLTDNCVVNEIPGSGYISARPCSALRIPCYNRIFGKNHDDRNCPRYVVRGRGTGRRAGDNDVWIECNQFAVIWSQIASS
jgi:hypothetical protein